MPKDKTDYASVTVSQSKQLTLTNITIPIVFIYDPVSQEKLALKTLSKFNPSLYIHSSIAYLS